MRDIQAGGGVVHRSKDGEQQVLLIFRNDIWDIPKGKREDGEDIEQCARREVAEETGIAPPVIERFITKTYHTYERNDYTYKKETFWYLMKGQGQGTFTPQQEEGITAVQWTEIGEAIEKVGYNNLVEVLEKIKSI